MDNFVSDIFDTYILGINIYMLKYKSGHGFVRCDYYSAECTFVSFGVDFVDKSDFRLVKRVSGCVNQQITEFFSAALPLGQTVDT